jgi:hypothetical protein
VKALIEEAETPLQALIFDATGQDMLDITSAEMPKGLAKELHGKALTVYVADLHAPVREFSRRTGLLDLISEKTFSQPLTIRCVSSKAETNGTGTRENDQGGKRPT